jgi:hypothetical protein
MTEWNDKLLPRTRAEKMAAGWGTYTEVHLRCGMPAHSRDEAQRGDRTCGQSMGVLGPDTTADDRLAMTVRHMVMAHDRKLSGAPDD